MKKINPSKDVEIKKWKMIRQQYINKLCNYQSSGFSLIPHDKDILLKAEYKLSELQKRKALSFDEIKEKFCSRKKGC